MRKRGTPNVDKVNIVARALIYGWVATGGAIMTPHLHYGNAVISGR